MYDLRIVACSLFLAFTLMYAVHRSFDFNFVSQMLGFEQCSRLVVATATLAQCMNATQCIGVLISILFHRCWASSSVVA